MPCYLKKSELQGANCSSERFSEHGTLAPACCDRILIDSRGPTGAAQHKDSCTLHPLASSRQEAPLVFRMLPRVSPSFVAELAACQSHAGSGCSPLPA